jgi:hypothetical protein
VERTDRGSRKGFHCYFNEKRDHLRKCRPKRSAYTPLDNRSSIVKVTLARHKISRTLICPAGRSFNSLSKAIQAAFGWVNMHNYGFSARDTSVGKRRFKLFFALVHPIIKPKKTYWSEFDDDQPMNDHNHRTFKCTQLRYGDVFGLEPWQDAEWSYAYDGRGHTIEVLGRGEPVEGFICSEALGEPTAEEDDGSIELEAPRRDRPKPIDLEPINRELRRIV